MTEQERLLKNDNIILQNKNIHYANGEEQAKKHLEQFKQNLIENFNEAELREEFIDECKDTEKQESIKLENVDSLFAHKRFICKEKPRINHPSMYRVIEDTLTGNEYEDSLKDIDDIVDLLNKLNEENKELKERVKQLQIDNTVIQKRYDALIWENDELRKEHRKLHDKLCYTPPIWFTQSIKLTDKEFEKVADAIDQSLKERSREE